MKNILVTGGAGYIGSHTVVELVEAGYEPVIIDNFANSDKSMLKGLEKIIGRSVPHYEHDYQDADFIKIVMKDHAVDSVIHFAAYKAVGESVEQPLKYYRNNVAGLITLLEVMEELKIPNLVFSSSCTVYGEAEQFPLTEDSPVQPGASPYGSTKQMGETIVHDVTAASQSLKSLRLRYFNPIGAHPSANIGELPRNLTNLVPFITQAVAGWQDKITVFGDDYPAPSPDGTCVRDYIHVVDLARAHVKALEYLDKHHETINEVCNVGTGKGSSVLEVIKTFEQATGQKVPYEIGPRRAGDVLCAYASVDRAHKLLGWQAEKSLAEALTDAWRWQQTLHKLANKVSM